MNAVLPANHPTSARAGEVRVLMIDDSVVVRSVVRRIFEDVSDISLVCTAGHLDEAYAFLANESVDIVLLDHEMPGQKGLDALPQMLKAARDAHVIMLSTHCQRGSKTAVAALSLGASDALAKPASGEAGVAFAEQLLCRVRRLTAARRHRASRNAPIMHRAIPDGFRAECIAIGASTGGIHALAELFQSFDSKPDIPILITQHLPAPFIPHYARQVARMCALPVTIARQGELLRGGHIYIAPGDASLSARRDGDVVCVELTDDVDLHSLARPSVNHMFHGIAQSYGAGALAIVLTGIGRDGTAGGRDVAKRGGVVLAQDQASSTIWGMPSSAAKAGLASALLPPSEMPRYWREHCGVMV